MNIIWGISGSSVKCSSYLHKATFGTGDCLKSCLFFFPLLFYWPVPSDNSTYNGLIHLITFFCSCSAMQNRQAGLLLPCCKPWLNNRGWKRVANSGASRAGSQAWANLWRASEGKWLQKEIKFTLWSELQLLAFRSHVVCRKGVRLFK